jgi:hypothetical protein
METSTTIIDYHLKELIEGQNSKITLSGRSKRNIPLPIFKNEPMGRTNDFTWIFPRFSGHTEELEV